jgi:hypothetical protein
MARWRARYESQIQQGPNGFDYAGVIQVLEKPFLKLSSEPTEIEARCDYPGNECGHMTTLCIPHQRVFFGFDLLYNGVHAWCGQGVGKGELQPPPVEKRQSDR